MSRIDDLAVLGLSPNANHQEIRAAYRQLCLVHHPDLGGDADIMSALNESFGRLLRIDEEPVVLSTSHGPPVAMSRGLMDEPISLWRVLATFVVIPSLFVLLLMVLLANLA